MATARRWRRRAASRCSACVRNESFFSCLGSLVIGPPRDDTMSCLPRRADWALVFECLLRAVRLPGYPCISSRRSKSEWACLLVPYRPLARVFNSARLAFLSPTVLC